MYHLNGVRSNRQLSKKSSTCSALPNHDIASKGIVADPLFDLEQQVHWALLAQDVEGVESPVYICTDRSKELMNYLSIEC